MNQEKRGNRTQQKEKAKRRGDTKKQKLGKRNGKENDGRIMQRYKMPSYKIKSGGTKACIFA